MADQIRCFHESVVARLRIFAGFTAFWLKYRDHLLINKPGALDAASGLYFLGSRSERVLSDRARVGLSRALDSL